MAQRLERAIRAVRRVVTVHREVLVQPPLEILGADQGQAVMQLFAGDDGAKNFERVEVLQDYAGRDRVLHAKMIM